MLVKFEHKKTREELEEALHRQIKRLRRAAAIYDEDNYEEAETLANVACTLLNESRGSQSLLGQLGIKSQLRFHDSTASAFKKPEVPGEKWNLGLPLCKLRVYGDRAEYRAPLDQREGSAAPGDLLFQEWWEQKVYMPFPEMQLSRRELAWTLRSQDGGTHVDDHIKNEAYLWLSTVADARACFLPGQGAVMAIGAGPPPEGRPIENGHWATMRQIAWELDKALTEYGL